MKKILAMLLALAMAFALVACGSGNSAPAASEPAGSAPAASAPAEEPAEEPAASVEDAASSAVDDAVDAAGGLVKEDGTPFKVGIVTYYVNSSFESSFNTAAAKRCDELGLEHQSYDANQDMAAYQTCFENAAVDGCDAIVCVPSDPTAMGPQCDVCEEYGIVLVVMAVAPDGYFNSALVVDMEVKGAMKAQAIVDACGDGCKVLMLLGNQQQTGWVQENDAAKAVFAEHNVEIVAEEDPQAQMELGQSYMETWLAQGLEFDAIWVATDTVAAGACAALEQANYDFDSVFIASEDGDETGLLLVQNGQVDCTLSLSGIMYGTGTVDLAAQWLAGETPDAEATVEIQWVTSENVDEYLAMLG